jgi:hypothetical protein
VVFAQEADFRYSLNTLEDFKALYDVKVYGFCLMDESRTPDPASQAKQLADWGN